jgi:hypothetical protein
VITTVETFESMWDMWQIGPIILLSAYDGELLVTMQLCHNQGGQEHSTGVLTKWTVDGEVVATHLEGVDACWGVAWEKFLDLLPEALQPEIAHCERQFHH